MLLTAGTFDDLYLYALRTILEHGAVISPRGMSTRELTAVSLHLDDASYGLLGLGGRRLNYTFAFAEFLWIITGGNDVETIATFNSQMRRFSDDGVTMSGAYGPKVAEQLPYVIKALTGDECSRQAVLTIWRERPGPSKDIPCTIALQFLMRKGKLNLITTMRSNDVWLGLPYDVFTFTRIQAYVAAALGVSPGWYRHQVGSLHLYSEQAETARELFSDLCPIEGTPLELGELTYPVPPVVSAMLRAPGQIECDVDPPWRMYADMINIRWDPDGTCIDTGSTLGRLLRTGTPALKPHSSLPTMWEHR